MIWLDVVAVAALLLVSRHIRYRLARRRYSTQGYKDFDPRSLRTAHQAWARNRDGWRAKRPRTRVNRRTAAYCHRQVRAIERAARKQGVRL